MVSRCGAALTGQAGGVTMTTAINAHGLSLHVSLFTLRGRGAAWRSPLDRGGLRPLRWLDAARAGMAAARGAGLEHESVTARREKRGGAPHAMMAWSLASAVTGRGTTMKAI